MTKGEERALEFLPAHPNEGIERQRKRFRGFYVDGYEQAEKDLALTPQDISTILNIDMDYQNEMSITGKIPSHEEQMKEILRRFQELKARIDK